MIYYVGKQKIRTPETGPKRRVRTPNQVVPWRDMAETCRSLDAVCSRIKTPPESIVDGIARVGFWGAVFRSHWPECRIHFNDKEEICVPVLRDNFPEDEVTSQSVRDWCPDECDLAMLDFDKFTLHKIDHWRDVLKKWSACCRHLIFVDGAAFGFKFGNLQSYGVDSLEGYVKKLDGVLREFQDKRVVAASNFVNATVILMEERKGRRINFLPPTNLRMSRGGNDYHWRGEKSGGFGFGS